MMMMAASTAAESGHALSPAEISSLRLLPGNEKCADCSVAHPQWASISHGIVVCLECSGAHRGLGVHVSFVRSLTLDDWTSDQLGLMMAGGNDQCNEYLKSKGVLKVECKSGDRNIIRPKYCGSEAAAYRNELTSRAGGGDRVSEQKNHASASSANQSNGSSEPATLGDDAIPPAPSAYHPLVYHQLLGRNGITPPIFASIILGTGALAFTILPRIFSKYNPTTVRLVCTAILGLPVAAVGGIVWKLGNALVQNRQEPYKSARNGLLERIRAKRAHRKKGYDLYVPDLSKVTNNEVDVGLILIPGALVDHTAYATIASRLSDAGILVAVMNSEPYRLPTNETGASKVEVLKIMYDVIAGGADGDDVGVAAVKEWTIGGHSMGAFQAHELCGEMKPGISKLVMWGYGRASDLRGSTLRDASVDALVLVGSEDGVYTRIPEGERQSFMQKLPRNRTTFMEIKGGNHAGFAHYGPQTFPVTDGVRTITLDQQQDTVVNATANFLLGNSGAKAKNE